MSNGETGNGCSAHKFDNCFALGESLFGSGRLYENMVGIINNLGTTEMQRAVENLMEHYREYPALASVSSQYQANVPQYFLNIDRDKVQLMGIQLNSVFTALGYYMGEAYVNDYVQFGRIYQVKLGAGDRAQRVIDDVLKLSVSNASGEMVPFSSFTQIDEL